MVTNKSKSKLKFLSTPNSVFDWIIFGFYAIVAFSFIPLFVVLMTLFKLHFKDLYNQIKLRIILMFSVFIMFLMLRLYIYADLKSLKIFFKEPTIYSTIPFYLTEVIISASLSYILLYSSKMEMESNNTTNGNYRTSDDVVKRFPDVSNKIF